MAGKFGFCLTLDADCRQCQSRRQAAVFRGNGGHVVGLICFWVLNRYLSSVHFPGSSITTCRAHRGIGPDLGKPSAPYPLPPPEIFWTQLPPRPSENCRRDCFTPSRFLRLKCSHPGTFS